MLPRERILGFSHSTVRKIQSFFFKINSFDLPILLKYCFAVMAWTACFLFLKNQFESISGPAIFGDESSYFEYGRNFALGKPFNSGQAAPLYPWCISWLMSPAKSILKAYSDVRFFNAFIFSLIFWPFFLLSKDFIDGFLRRILLCSMFCLLPWGTLTPLIMIESVFYFIYAIALLFIYYSFKAPSPKASLLAGTAVTLLFITKQAGIVLLISFVIAEGAKGILEPKNRRQGIKNLFWFFVPISLGVGGYIRNRMLNPSAGAIGYASAVNVISNGFFDFVSSSQFYITFAHQISYVVVSSYLFFALFYFKSVFNLNNTEPAKKYLTIISFFTIIGLSIMTAFFFNTFGAAYSAANETKLSNGRYLAPLIPLIILIAIEYLDRFGTQLKKIQTFIIFLFCIGFIAFFSPAWSAKPIGSTTSVDVVYLAELYKLRDHYWEPNNVERIYEASKYLFPFSWALVCGLFFLLYRYHFKKIVILFSIALCLYTRGPSVRNMLEMGAMVRPEHDFYRYLINNKIELNSVYYLKNIVDRFKVQFWYGEDATASWMPSHEENEAAIPSLSADQYLLTGKAYKSDMTEVFSNEVYKLYKAKKHP
jgi:hypothetical protein